MVFKPYYRRDHLRELWSHGLWGKGIGGAWSIYGGFAAWRSEAIKTADLDQYGILKLIPHLSLSGWLFGAAIILCGWIFEASFRSERRTKRKVYDLERDVERLELELSKEKEIKRELLIRFDGSMVGFTLSGSHLSYMVSVKNNSDKSTIRNCQIETWIPVAGDFAQENYWAASEPFDLKPHQTSSREILKGSLTDPSAPLEQVQYFKLIEGDLRGSPMITRILPPNPYNVFVRVTADDKSPAYLEILLSHNGRWDAFVQKHP